MATKWNPPTLADDLGENASRRCAACGRTVPADMLVDVRPAGLEVRASRALPDAAKGPPAAPEGYECDGCRERAVREGRIDRPTMVERLGGPPALVDELRQREARR